jgi:hypothetical protein
MFSSAMSFSPCQLALAITSQMLPHHLHYSSGWGGGVAIRLWYFQHRRVDQL